jgi:hypothetical protein
VLAHVVRGRNERSARFLSARGSVCGMLQVVRMLARSTLVLLVAWLSAVGCGGDDAARDVDAGTLGRCTSLDGRAFSSVDLQPDCGLGPDGPVPCHWRIEFDATTTVYTGWQYYHSDVGESGDIGCVGTSIVLVSPDHAASFDATTDRLAWDDIVYAPE